MLPYHFSTPDNQYLASITPKGLATIALAILASAEATKFDPTVFSGTSFSIVLSRQKYTALLMPVFMVLTRSPLQNAAQPSSILMQEKAKQIFLRKLLERVSRLGGTISAILILSRGWSTAAVVVPARYPQYPFFLPITIVDFNLIMLCQIFNMQNIPQNHYSSLIHHFYQQGYLIVMQLAETAKMNKQM